MGFKVGQVVSVKWDNYYYIRAVVVQKPKGGKVVVDVGFDEYRVPVRNVKEFNKEGYQE